MAATNKQIREMLDKLYGPIRTAFLDVVGRIKTRVQLQAAARAIERNDINALYRAAGYRGNPWAELTESIRRAYIEGGTFTMSADLPKSIAMDFNFTSPAAEAWLAEHSSNLITYITYEQQQAVQEVLLAGVNAGRNPRSIALDIVGRIDARTQRRTGGIIGLNAPQTEAAINARQQLEDLDSAYFQRVRRDRRYDSMVRKAIANDEPLSQADINRIVGRYEDRLLELRGTTIGRTEALQAFNASADESLRQVVEEGLAAPQDAKRIWVHSGNDNERPGHLALSGTAVGLDEPWTNPETGVSLMHPGEGPASETINCRCGVKHQIDFIAIEQRNLAAA